MFRDFEYFNQKRQKKGDPKNIFEFTLQLIENTSSIKEKMARATNPKTGEKIYTKATGYSLLIFYAFALQCMATVAIVFRETGGWKWPIIQLIYMGALAYLSSLLVYQIFA